MNFAFFGPSHIAALSITFISIILLLLYARRQDAAGRKRIARFIALLLALQMLIEYSSRFLLDEIGYPSEWSENLPLAFCGVMSIISIIALCWQTRWACIVTYFGVFTCCIQALLTPALKSDFPSPIYWNFFISHGLLMVAGVSVPLLLGWRAGGWDDLKAVLMMDLYLICIYAINTWLGSNYGFTQEAPAGSVLTLLGPAPWYYLWLQLPAWGIFRFLYLFVYDKRSDQPKLV